MRVRYFSRLVGKALIIVFVGSVAGITSNFLRPYGLPLFVGEAQQAGIPKQVLDQIDLVPVHEAYELRDVPGVVFVDVRPKEDRGEGRIPGSIRLPENRFEVAYPQVSARLLNARTVLLYCTAGKLSMSVATRLVKKGYSNVAVLVPGFTGWKAAGYEFELPGERGTEKGNGAQTQGSGDPVLNSSSAGEGEVGEDEPAA